MIEQKLKNINKLNIKTLTLTLVGRLKTDKSYNEHRLSRKTTIRLL